MKALSGRTSLVIAILLSAISLISINSGYRNITVTGTVVGSDAPTIGLSNALITLSGTETYTTTTNGSGNFGINDVLPNQTYNVTVTHEGYDIFETSITVGTVNFHMGTIILNEYIYPPVYVMAMNLGTSVYLDWPDVNWPLVGYKVWRLNSGQETNEQNWTYLTPTVIVASQYTDTNWFMLPPGLYKWAVKTVYANNVLSLPAFSNELEKPVSNPEEIVVVRVNALNANFPNPFNPTTSISYSIAKAGEVSLNVYNTKGQLVKTLVNAMQPSGTHTIVWNGLDDSGKAVATGMYLYKMKSGRFTSIKKMMLLK